MKTSSFCDTMYSDLVAIRSHMHDMIRKLERVPEEADGHLGKDISTMARDLDGKIDQLKRECPVEWRAHHGDDDAAVESRIEHRGVYIGT